MKKDKGQKAQSERFISKAKELGADESGEAFERAMTHILPPKKTVKNQLVKSRKLKKPE